VFVNMAFSDEDKILPKPLSVDSLTIYDYVYSVKAKGRHFEHMLTL